MFFKLGLSIVFAMLKLMVMISVFVSGFTAADSLSGTLTIKPGRCIALQQGQACFATLKFQWTTPASGEYCLYDERQSEPLVCWRGNTVATYKEEFESDRNVKYEIRTKQSGRSLAQALVKISWVYKSNTSSTSRWRMF